MRTKEEIDQEIEKVKHDLSVHTKPTTNAAKGCFNDWQKEQKAKLELLYIEKDKAEE